MKKLVLGSLLLAVLAGPAFAKDGRHGGPGGIPNTGADQFAAVVGVVGVNNYNVEIGDTRGDVTQGGQYSVNANVTHIGASVAQQGFANVDLHAPDFAANTGGSETGAVYNGPSNASVVSATYEKGAIAFNTLRREDGLTDIIQSLVGVGNDQDSGESPNISFAKPAATGYYIAFGAIGGTDWNNER